MTRDEENPIERTGELPVPEVGDLGSFEREPEGGDPDAPEPELDHSRLWDGPDVADDQGLDLTADDPPPDDQASGYSRG